MPTTRPRQLIRQTLWVERALSIYFLWPTVVGDTALYRMLQVPLHAEANVVKLFPQVTICEELAHHDGRRHVTFVLPNTALHDAVTLTHDKH